MSIKSNIESLLFISAKPMSFKKLANFLKVSEAEISQESEALFNDYKQRESGLKIIKNDNSLQMVTSSASAGAVSGFLKDETTGELSRPSLETLTIIAYRSPISKTDLDRIRGINCSLILRNLLVRGLIEARDDKQKDETYYNVSFDFLKFLGIEDVTSLPDYDKLSHDDSIDKMLEANQDKDSPVSNN